ncbi:MAG: hypothetical protein PF484_10035 [Bacteroidales bacterium]|jgi:hypothetical protein|nr:hypothetical protein [Bacteroidales bacterium]
MIINTAFEEMEIVLNELNEQFETIKKNEARIPQIEIDIIMASIRKLYESMSHLNRQLQFAQINKTVEIVTEKVESDIDMKSESITENIISNKPDAKVEETIPEETKLFDEDLGYEKVTKDFLHETGNLEDEAKSELQEEIPEKEIPEAIITKSEESKPSLLLQFEDEIFSINESVAQKGKDKSVVNKLSNTRIENLKSAIGINDKFYFINELFSGNSQAYEDVIYTLNNFKRFEEAMQYVSTLRHRYDWKTDAEAYQKLSHFLERKFLNVHA